ncbi:hypothetical protein U1Q18_026323 [Sarracenia purpurea var. burkii]
MPIASSAVDRSPRLTVRNCCTLCSFRCQANPFNPAATNAQIAHLRRHIAPLPPRPPAHPSRCSPHVAAPVSCLPDSFLAQHQPPRATKRHHRLLLRATAPAALRTIAPPLRVTHYATSARRLVAASTNAPPQRLLAFRFIEQKTTQPQKP